MINVIKRSGKTQIFSEKKLASSIVKSCLSAGETSHSAKNIAQATVLLVNDWLSPKTEVTTNDIRHHTSILLTKQCHDAGYIYKYHRIMD